MENIDNYYIQVELLERYFEVKITPAEFGDWLIARGRYGGWDSGYSVIKGETVWRSYEPGRLERLENGGPETIIGLPFRVSVFLLNEQGHFSSDYRDCTPIQFSLVKRGNWTEVTAVCKPPGAWPETADRLHGMFDWLIDQIEERFGDNFRWVGTGETAVTNQPGVGGDGAGETAVYLPKQAARLNRWRVTWHKIRDLAERGDSSDEICKKIQLNPAEYPLTDPKTIRKVIAAGLAGKLDP